MSAAPEAIESGSAVMAVPLGLPFTKTVASGGDVVISMVPSCGTAGITLRFPLGRRAMRTTSKRIERQASALPPQSFGRALTNERARRQPGTVSAGGALFRY